MICKRLLAFFLIIWIIISSGCTEQAQRLKNDGESKTMFVLGTVATIQIYDNASEEIFDKIFDRLRAIEDKMTINKENSEVIDINKSSGIDFIRVSDDTFYVIEKGKFFSELSDGGFDISIGPIVKLWNIGSEKARIPSQKELEENMPLVNYKDIMLNESEKSVMLPNKGMKLDLGGIAKGFAVDEVVKIFKENGIKHGLINIGGNIFVHGSRPNGEPWKIGIQDPSFSPVGDYVGVVSISDKTIVTSGIYERYFEENGIYYHHILDPGTGYPVDNDIASVTIIGEHSIDADALSTAAFVLGLKKGMKFIEEMQKTEAIWITKDNRIYLSSGIKDQFKLTHPEFTLLK